MRISFFTFGILLCGFVVAMPTVSRKICANEYSPGGIYRVEVQIAADSGEMPPALIISEDWPDGFKIVDSYWNGMRFIPVQRGGSSSWLFGYGEGNPDVGSGVISYMLSVPEECRWQRPQVFGTVSIAGDEQEIIGDEEIEFAPDGTAPLAEWLEMPPGWSLHVMPFHSGTTVEEVAGGGACFTLSTENAWIRRQKGKFAPGTPFWVWRKRADSIVLTEDFPPNQMVTQNPASTESWMIKRNFLLNEESEVVFWHNNAYLKGKTTNFPGEAGWIQKFERGER